MALSNFNAALSFLWLFMLLLKSRREQKEGFLRALHPHLSSDHGLLQPADVGGKSLPRGSPFLLCTAVFQAAIYSLFKLKLLLTKQLFFVLFCSPFKLWQDSTRQSDSSEWLLGAFCKSALKGPKTILTGFQRTNFMNHFSLQISNEPQTKTQFSVCVHP